MNPEQFNQQNFEHMQQMRQQQFQSTETSRILLQLKLQNDELVRTLKQYNDFVKENNCKIEEREKAQQIEMQKIEKLRTRFTIINIGIAVVGVIASALVGIFF